MSPLAPSNGLIPNFVAFENVPFGPLSLWIIIWDGASRAILGSVGEPFDHPGEDLGQMPATVREPRQVVERPSRSSPTRQDPLDPSRSAAFEVADRLALLVGDPCPGKALAAIGDHRGPRALFRVILRSRRGRPVPGIPFRLRRRVRIFLARQGIGLGSQAPSKPVQLQLRGVRRSPPLTTIPA